MVGSGWGRLNPSWRKSAWRKPFILLLNIVIQFLLIELPRNCRLLQRLEPLQSFAGLEAYCCSWILCSFSWSLFVLWWVFIARGKHRLFSWWRPWFSLALVRGSFDKGTIESLKEPLGHTLHLWIFAFRYNHLVGLDEILISLRECFLMSNLLLRHIGLSWFRYRWRWGSCIVGLLGDYGCLIG